MSERAENKRDDSARQDYREQYAADLAKKEMEAVRRGVMALEGEEFEKKLPEEIRRALSATDSETVAKAVADWLKVAPLPDPNKEIEKALERLRT